MLTLRVQKIIGRCNVDSKSIYGTITGAGSFYDPATLCRGNTFITPVNDPEYQAEDLLLHRCNQRQRGHIPPTARRGIGLTSRSFLYAAYTTAHWPMHALPQ